MNVKVVLGCLLMCTLIFPMEDNIEQIRIIKVVVNSSEDNISYVVIPPTMGNVNNNFDESKKITFNIYQGLGCLIQKLQVPILQHGCKHILVKKYDQNRVLIGEKNAVLENITAYINISEDLERRDAFSIAYTYGSSVKK